ncbi:thiamine pyrophosphate-dependent dehydrogenase E1 component subunit alpha [Hahella sp. KA22]|uniref:thiamine pyrophosphate-dependent dehydrogenase E1 component subunit alpha n=1 Tax=Hahella sp. KA22 TaxID=1628392 RepID=UPI000FDF3AEA|nr:thiamine pyrophosphate-dependent dehydrogenase E1 component subunit alpha [Hahella sp. KA22]AZZ92221.1 thiamine pyrophosphate-dependent dehydrogenase E1 component subunit alpha [Hahella sp. KA22]QAY55592.1 thiamine pyrophosphate-dependent dehydrogenase E1 component subunit alpha [Hahella sp. KA22]
MSQTTKTIEVIHKPEFIQGNEFKFPIFQVLKQDGATYKGAKLPEMDQEEALKIYRTMVFTRVLDERMLAAQRQGRLSFYLQSTGEEGTVVGFAAALDDRDMIMAQYREQGALAYRGFSVDEFMNQLFGNELDYGKGRQMPIHYGSAKLNYMTISSPLATQIPQAAGYAYGQKLEGKGLCTVTVFGEGAASEGDFHAALNMASVHKVPVIFLCRNNGYAISTPSSEQFAADGIAPRALGYSMRAIRVDGNDILAVYLATQAARKIAVEENEPVLIEAMTYRLAAHSSSDDPSGYRSKKEEDVWRAKDPIARMRNWMIKKKWWSEDEEKQLQDSMRQEVLDAMKNAEKRPPPPVESLVTDVYDEVTPQLHEQLEKLKMHVRKYPDAYPKSAGRMTHG